jgi:hypothetical protein
MEKQIAAARTSLVKAGWEKRGVYDEPRLSEVMAMYAEIGLEVRQEPFDPAGEPGCSACMRSDATRYRTVYTRKKAD